MATQDVFNPDGFTLSELTAAINELPHVPTQLGDSGLFEYAGVSNLTVQIEKQGEVLALVQSAPRGAPGAEIGRNSRNLRYFGLAHLPLKDALMADEVQGVRTFGDENAPLPIDTKRNEILNKGRRRYDLTLEYHRVNALKGILLDADGSVMYNFFDEFGVTQNTLDFELDQAGTDVRLKCDTAINMIEDELGGNPYSGMVAYCGRTFWQSLIGHKSVKETYLNQAQAAQLRNSPVDALDFGGVRWIKYRGAANGSQMIGANDAYIVPTGVSGLLLGRFGPANYMETVNTIGLPIYAKGIPRPNNTAVDIEMQSNPLHLLTRPRAVIKASI
jgi:hypothetical protein